ncbi:MAG TPA: 16S rRNA (cytidine(1402)-2'-O)-methyltransferase, partial [Acidobacteriaceae bacterium]|nr:16S rRNA (cytidine(1402)-2'-O)-methyltransferase [Acidobacteriaceae bacterium]
VLATLQQRPTIRGEIVLLLDGTLTTTASPPPAQQSLADEVQHLIRNGLSEKDALKQVAKSRNLGKSEAYREYQRTRVRTVDKRQ